MKKDSQQFVLDLIAQTIYDKKGFNILGLDITKISSLTQYLIIAEGNVDRHVQSLGNAVIDELKKKGIRPYRVEGRAGGDWIVIDFVDIMVHLFMPGLREKYALEKLWQEGEIVDLAIDIDEEEKKIGM